ncbi:hypothetical protein F5887DRAFT_1192482 [Amanita rubescens]|nr:hypothetical protein F5887DRAFT_1192482 [Amanita rubescens]
MWVRQASLDCLFLFLLIHTTGARFVNISIDDTYGDLATGQKPIYWPSASGVYSAWYYSAKCGTDGCGLVSNTSLAFNGTWTAASYDPTSPYKTTGLNITLSFTGISIWVFFIIANTQNPDASELAGPVAVGNVSIPFNTACNFTLDGNDMGPFFHQTNGTPAIQYNASVFNATGLDNSQHELVIWTKGVNQTNLIFDYAIYTADIPDNATSSTLIGSSSTRTIAHPTQTAKTYISSSNRKLKIAIGCAFGGLGFIALLVALAFRFRRSRRSQKVVIEPILTTSFNRQLLVGGSDGVKTSNTTDLQQQNSASQNENPGPSEGIMPNQHGIVHSHSFDSTGRLVPFRQFQSSLAPNRKGQDGLRAMRQMEINQHLQTAQQEMQDLTPRQSAMRSETSSDVIGQETDREMEVMREQIHRLNTRMEHLHMQLSSDLAQGLSDEPPPTYY